MGHGAVKPGSRERALHAHRFTGIGDKSWAAATPISGFLRWLGHTSWVSPPQDLFAGDGRHPFAQARPWRQPVAQQMRREAAHLAATTGSSEGGVGGVFHRHDACDGRPVSGCGDGGGGSSRRSSSVGGR